VKPKERAILALTLKQPDIVPTFELEFQLTEEYFGKSFHTLQDWKYAITKKAQEQLIIDNAELYIQIAEYFNYCIIMDSYAYYPDDDLRIESAKWVKKLSGDNYMVMLHGDATYAIPEGKDMLEFAYRLADRSDEVKVEAKRRVECMLERGKRLRDAGVDGVALCSDYCFNTGPFLSPKMFSEFITPYLYSLIQGYRKMGFYVIKHTDGNIMPIIEDIISCEPHGLHSLDPQAGVDIKKVKELYGDKVCLIGNVNCALLHTGTREEILAAARYCMEFGKPGGGYIFSTSNVVYKGIPKENYDLMMEYYRANCRY
jgi:uroporphyrinogen decarboxylase